MIQRSSVADGPEWDRLRQDTVPYAAEAEDIKKTAGFSPAA